MADGSRPQRNDLTIYDAVSDQWWSDEIRWVRTLKNMVPGRLRWFDKHVSWQGKRVLDLGCAGGFMAEAIAEKGAQVDGIDPSVGAIAAARVHAETQGLDITYKEGVGEALPYPDASFDIVVCVDVLEHVSDLPQVLREVARVLKPGGVFLFDTINKNILARLAVITVAEDILGLLPKGTHDPDMFIPRKDLLAGLRAAGMETGPTTGLGPRGITRRGDFTFGQVPMTAIIYMGVARKPE